MFSNFICRAGFHLPSESAGSTVEFLQLCIPVWDVVSLLLLPLGIVSLAELRMAPVNSFTFSLR